MITLLTQAIPDKPFDAIEIHPCQTIEKGKDGGKDVVEQCEEKDAEFFSVYVHYTSGGLECIADCNTKQEAESLEKFLKGFVEKSKMKFLFF